MSFYSELKRRNVLRAAAGYIVCAWLIVQVADTVLPAFGLSDTGMRILVIVLAIGFLPAIAISWAFELTPQGWRRESSIALGGAEVTRATRRLDRIIMVVLALGIAYFGFDKFILSAAREEMIADQAREEALAAMALLRNNKSVAVLPFEDLSPDGDQEYFVDGITEELLNQLVLLRLNVAGRTSAFAYKDVKRDLITIGEELGVSYILDGSVRKDGDSLRITAQLNDASDGTSVWTDTYDRQLTHLFAIQDEIALAVAGALSIALDVDDRDHLLGTGTDSLEAYDLFLKARYLQRARGFNVARPYYVRATQVDPDYAEAYAMLGMTYGAGSYSFDSVKAREAQERGIQLVDKALEINPDLPIALDFRSRFQWTRKDWVGAARRHEEFAAAAPADIPAQYGSETILARTGRLGDALLVMQLTQVHRPDPLNFLRITSNIERLIQSGRFDEAREELALADRLHPPPEQATDLRRFLLAVTLGEPDGVRKSLQDYARADAGAAPVMNTILAVFDAGPEAALVEMRRVYREDIGVTGEGRVVLASMAAFFDDPEFALQIFSDELAVNVIRINRIWYPHFSGMRNLDGFKELARSTGLLEYWRTYGWADTCRPLGDDDFECR